MQAEVKLLYHFALKGVPTSYDFLVSDWRIPDLMSQVVIMYKNREDWPRIIEYVRNRLCVGE
jgi:hypothetical protein